MAGRESDNKERDTMDQQKLFDTVQNVLVDTFGVDAESVTADATFESLELDSLDLVELTLLIEEETGVKIEDDEVEQIRTVGDAVSLISEKSKVGA
jgi:acyl carrier protein